MGVMTISTFRMAVIQRTTLADLTQGRLRFDKVLTTLQGLLGILIDGTDIVFFHACRLLGIANGHVIGHIKIGLDVRDFTQGVVNRRAGCGMAGKTGFFNCGGATLSFTTGPNRTISTLAQ